jgi:hypothetical protein
VPLLTFREKNEDRYFDASTPEKRALACLTVLRDRMKDSYWYTRPEQPEFSQETLDLAAVDDEAFFTTSGLPESIASDLYSRHFAAKQRIRNAQAEFDQENSWFVRADAVLALSEEDFLKDLAENPKQRSEPELLLAARDDYEYEGFDVRTMEIITP